MKTFRLFAALAVAVTIGISTTLAAPVESVDSASASSALQKVDTFLSEKAVADQLTKLGVTSAQVKARLAQLSDAQLVEVAAQIDTLQVGGTIQGGNPNPLGPLGCVLHQIGQTIAHVIKFIFCFNDVR